LTQQLEILLKYLQQQLRFYGNYFTVSKSAEEDVNKLRETTVPKFKRKKNTDLKILTVFHGQIIEKVLKLVYMRLILKNI
jgi:predicted secreted protein